MKLIPRNTIFYILQGKLRGRRWIVGSGQHSYWLGSYEYKNQLFFAKVVKKGAVVYDIGAHVGFYTLLASILVGSNGKVFAFEPSLRNIRYLKKNLRLNRCDNVTLIEAAVSDKDGQAYFDEGFASYSGHLSLKGNLKVETISLNKFVLEDGFPPPDFIKIDTEGSELLILSDAKEMLIKYKPTIFLSTHGADLHLRCWAFLNSLNYDLQLINENINNANELMAF